MQRPVVGGALHLPERRPRSPASAPPGVGVAHCPSSNMMIGGGGHRAGAPSSGPPACRSASAATARRRPTRASLWMEARNALLLGRLRHGPGGRCGARDALEIATRGGAGCLGRDGEIGELSRRARSATSCAGRSRASRFAGALTDPIEAWLRCGPVAARHTVVAGRAVVRDGDSVSDRVDEHAAPPPPRRRAPPSPPLRMN